jgi:hypothetical protein
MTSENGAGHPGRYSIAFLPRLLDQLAVWAEEAKRLELAADFRLVLRRMRHRLSTDPREWGDVLREYQTIKAVEMRGMIPKWLLVWYGVDDGARQVIVRNLLPAPGSPHHHPSRAVTGSPFTSSRGWFRWLYTMVSGLMPTAWYTVASSSVG